MFTDRTLGAFLAEQAHGLDLMPVWLVLGPRQVGKSSLLRRVAGPDRQVVDLDELAIRARCQADPIGFARELSPKVLLDEIQYAPSMLSAVKRMVDEARYAGVAEPGMIWLTGSQQHDLLRGVQETLAGRVAVMNLYGFSTEEEPRKPDTPMAWFDQMAGSSFPALSGVKDRISRANYLSGYVRTYLERDLAEVIGLIRRREFEVFLKAVALRTAQEVNLARLASESGVSAPTITTWLGLLEGSGILSILPAWHSNRNKRLTKAPKLHFLDAGLGAHLAGWVDPEQWRLGPGGGAAFESFVVSEVVRFFAHRVLPVQLSHLRTRDGLEIDLLIEHMGRTLPLEVKLGYPDVRSLLRPSRVGGEDWARGIVVSLAQLGKGVEPLGEGWQVVGPDGLAGVLARWVAQTS